MLKKSWLNLFLILLIGIFFIFVFKDFNRAMSSSRKVAWLNVTFSFLTLLFWVTFLFHINNIRSLPNVLAILGGILFLVFCYSSYRSANVFLRVLENNLTYRESLAYNMLAFQASSFLRNFSRALFFLSLAGLYLFSARKNYYAMAKIKNVVLSLSIILAMSYLLFFIAYTNLHREFTLSYFTFMNIITFLFLICFAFELKKLSFIQKNEVNQ